MYAALSPKHTRGEFGSEVEMGLDSDPVTPSISGLRVFSQPNMLSNEWFSWTRTTTVLMGYSRGAAVEVSATIVGGCWRLWVWVAWLCLGGDECRF